jgi:antitoxin (DNA-binding transcriptional repressor) of toxin-antitoxin stability system
MTSDDYNMTMKKVGIADLKAHLSAHLRTVRKGRALTVVDRDTPVAHLVPVDQGSLDIRQASRRPRDLPKPPRRRVPTDSLALLLADRARR